MLCYAGGGFELVSCPHYLGEVVIYCGLALVAEGGRRVTAWLMLLWVVSRPAYLPACPLACLPACLPASHCLFLCVQPWYVCFELSPASLPGLSLPAVQRQCSQQHRHLHFRRL